MNYIKFFLLLSFFTTGIKAQCDLSITNFNHETGDLVIEAINSENCGCNDFTTDGNTCETSGSSHVANNETISHIVLGLHVEGLDYNWGCTTANNHPGWAFKVFTLFGNQVLESGDSWVANVYDSPSNNDCWAEILANDTLCTELVIWQINLSQTATTDNGGWAEYPNIAAQTQNYPDVDLSNNIAVNCALPACDTVYVDVEWITIDTIYVYEVDTLVEYVQLPPDTVQVIEYVEIYINDTTYIYITDTLSIFEILLIDCETGEECIEPPGISECWPWTVYIPNTFTPNGDGLNDVWQITYDLECWVDVEFRIFNRWGEMIYHGYDFNFNSYPFWDGSINGSGYYATDGVYVYTFYGRREDSPEILEESGHITIFR